MKEETRPAIKHEFEHETPTVIHNPEEDLTILAKWLRRGMAQGPRFWVLVAGIVVVAALLTTLANGLSAGRATNNRAWTELALATTPGQKVEIADEFPNSEVARAARLQAATNFFSDAVRGLPADREKAGPELKRALDLFQQIAKDAPKDSPEALAAAFGAARTLEARNELTEAIAQYKVVASGWPGTPEAKQSEKLVTQLQDPEIIAFYKELYNYKAPASTGLGGLPEGFGGLPAGFGGLPAGHPSLNAPTTPAGPLGLPPLPTGPLTPESGPLDIAPPPTLPAPATKGEMPAKAEPAKPATPATKAELPADPFTPAAKP
jgi:hypothetical protein